MCKAVDVDMNQRVIFEGEEMSDENLKPIELTPRDKAAADYVNNTIFTDETGDDETLIKNMRFMAFSAGADWGAKAERTRILKMMEEMCDEDVADAVTFGQYATANDLFAQLKQRLINPQPE